MPLPQHDWGYSRAAPGHQTVKRNLDPALVSAAARTIEHIVNATLNYDPGTQAALARLDGRVIALESTEPSFTLFLQTGDGRVHLFSHWEETVACRLRGTLPNLIRLLLAQPQHSLANTGVEVSGQPQLLSHLQQLAKDVDIDWEEPVTRLLGDVAGHQVANLLQTQWHWCRTQAPKVPVLLSDFLTEELRMLPEPGEVDYFYQAINTLRADTDRLEARLIRLQQTLA